MPGVLILIWCKNLLTKTKKVSKIGMPNIISGIRNETNCRRGMFNARAMSHNSKTLSRKLKTASKKPIKVDPPSPRKIEAGLKLYFKNPRVAPAKANDMTVRIGRLLFKASKKKNKDAKKAMPETRPSMPSNILKELVIKVMKQAVRI